MELHHVNITLAQRGNGHSYRCLRGDISAVFNGKLFVWFCVKLSYFLCLMCLGFYKDGRFLNDGHKHYEMEDILLPGLNFMQSCFSIYLWIKFCETSNLFIADLSVDNLLLDSIHQKMCCIHQFPIY